MTPSEGSSSVVVADARAATAGDRPGILVVLAGGWLSSEAASVGQPGRVELVRTAAERAIAYEDALAAASPEDVRRAWELAVVRQAQNEVGSASWAAAVRVSELLRFEYVAVREVRQG